MMTSDPSQIIRRPVNGVFHNEHCATDGNLISYNCRNKIDALHLHIVNYTELELA